MALPEVFAGGPHVGAHNGERILINGLQAVTDPVFKEKLDARFISQTELFESKTTLAENLAAITGERAAAVVARTGAETARDEAVDISNIAVTDDVVEALVQPGAAGPKTKGALTASYAPKRSLDVMADFGAVGNGVADDTAAIQAAITARGSNGVLTFPTGRTFRVTSSLDFGTSTGVLVTGGAGGGQNAQVGTGSTVIKYEGSGYAIKWATASASAFFAGITFEKIHIMGSGAIPDGGMWLGNGSNVKLRDVTISDFRNGTTTGTGIKCGTPISTGAQYWEFHGLTIGKCDIGADLVDVNGVRFFGGNFEDSMIPRAGTIGVRVSSASEAFMFGTVVQGWDTLIDCSGPASQFQGVRCEGFTTRAYRINNAKISVIGGSINNSIVGSVGVGIDITAAAVATFILVPNVSSVATKLINAGSKTTALVDPDDMSRIFARIESVHTSGLRVNKVGAGAQDPALTLESNGLVGPTLKTENFFAKAVLDHAHSSATGLDFRLIGTTYVSVVPNGLKVNQAATIKSATGLPSSYAGVGIAGALGDIYIRTDTPATSLQRLYVCTTAGAAGAAAWTAIL